MTLSICCILFSTGKVIQKNMVNKINLKIQISSFNTYLQSKHGGVLRNPNFRQHVSLDTCLIVMKTEIVRKLWKISTREYAGRTEMVRVPYYGILVEERTFIGATSSLAYELRMN